MDAAYDVVVVGAGIAGCAVAKVAVAHGASVLVLERQTAYRDKVRGEYLHPWGVAEARTLGVEEVLLAGGGTWVTHAVGYDELFPAEVAEAHAVTISSLRPDIGVSMDLGHPQTCRALAESAERAGASIVRGVGDVSVTPGRSPVVRYEHDDVEHEVRTRLVVGADGRASSVRRQVGIELHATQPLTMGGGMLVEDLDAWPEDRIALGTEGDLHYLLFPRRDGVARLYLMHAIEQRGRFTGPGRERHVLDAFRMRCLPLGDEIARATPAGPVAFYPMHDTWTDQPYEAGVVLVGDAAGFNDPIIGEGLSIALRDARMVGEVVTASDDWGSSAFEGYGLERAERMRRLRLCAQLDTALRCTFTPAGRERRGAWLEAMASDPLIAAATVVTAIAGPDVAPPEAFEPDNVCRILALA